MIKDKRIVTAIIVVVLAIIVLIILTIISSSRFRLVGSIPATTGTISTITSVIKLDFNKYLESKDYIKNINGNNKDIVREVEVQGSSLLLHLSPLENKSYSFDLSSVSSSNKDVIDNINFNFTAEYIPFDKLSKAQQDLEVSNTDRNNIEDPLLEFLPHEGERMYIEAEYIQSEEGESELIINSDIYLTLDEVVEDRAVVMKRYEDKIRNFISSKNLNPDDYNIYYEINQPPVRSD